MKKAERLEEDVGALRLCTRPPQSLEDEGAEGRRESGARGSRVARHGAAS